MFKKGRIKPASSGSHGYQEVLAKRYMIILLQAISIELRSFVGGIGVRHFGGIGELLRNLTVNV